VLPKENEKFMKKDKITQSDELRDEYELSDFPAPLVRGKYVERLRESSNVVVLKPEVAAAFPNEEAVNHALLSLIKLAQTTTRLTDRSN
jgi:predicted alternative tryptophan synthase beta-subunit